MTSTLSCLGVSISTLITSTGRSIGNPIYVLVSATNSDGTSADGAISSGSIKYMSLPTSTPSGLAVTVSSSTSVSVSWTNLDVTLAESGFSAITMYTVEYKLSTDTTWNFGGNSTSTPVTISGLTSLSTYSFRVKATNVFGTGPTTLTANVVSATLYGVPSSPGQPTITQTSGSTSIVATWSAPSSSNGASITAYSI